jgi:hypothetical protein
LAVGILEKSKSISSAAMASAEQAAIGQCITYTSVMTKIRAKALAWIDQLRLELCITLLNHELGDDKHDVYHPGRFGSAGVLKLPGFEKEWPLRLINP